MNQRKSQSAPSPIIDNIEAVARMEHEFLERRTWSQRTADAIGGLAGSMTFVLLHVTWFTLWFLINTGHLFIRPFDPFPFIFLTMAVSMEAVLLSTFVLMKQNRMARRTEEREQLHLQIAMLSERESTKILQMLRAVCSRLEIEPPSEDKEAEELSQTTAVDQVMENLRERLP
ncbi:MAG: DUF1003 domain-containing protein [Acidobacteria bacterium]|nr:DUF1003 domain-containing protein [Acidobacteriota bacterium]